MKVNVTFGPEWAAFQKMLEGLPDAMNRQFMASLQKEMLKPVAQEMKAQLASQTNRVTGNLDASIGVRTLPRRSTFGTGTIAGQRYGMYKGWHANLIEFGTKERRARGGGKLKFKGANGRTIYASVVRGVKARPFIIPVAQRNIAVLQRTYPDMAQKHMLEYMRKKIRKAGGKAI